MNFDRTTGLMDDGQPVIVADQEEAIALARNQGVPVYCAIGGGAYFKSYPTGYGKPVQKNDIPGFRTPIAETQIIEVIQSGRLDSSLSLIQEAITERM